MRLSNQGQTLDSKAGVGGVWNYILKKDLWFWFWDCYSGHIKFRRGQRQKMKVQGLERSGSSVCRVSVVNVCSENGQMQTNGFLSLHYYLLFNLPFISFFWYWIPAQISDMFVCTGGKPVFPIRKWCLLSKWWLVSLKIHSFHCWFFNYFRSLLKWAIV